MPRASFLLRPCGVAAMGVAAGGVVTVQAMMGMAAIVTMPVTVTGLDRHRNGQKNGGRYEESHHNSLPLSCVMSGVRPEQARSPDAGWTCVAQPEGRHYRAMADRMRCEPDPAEALVKIQLRRRRGHMIRAMAHSRIVRRDFGKRFRLCRGVLQQP